MTAKTDLPPLPERFDCTNGSAQWCYGCYTMTRDDLGDYVLAEDYDALRNASEALQAEIEALRTELDRLRGEHVRVRRDRNAAQARAERMEKALRLIESAKDRGFGIDYARGVAQSILLHDQEEGHEQ